MHESFYALEAQSMDKQPISMSSYQGKVVLVVNTASQCGLTPQYAGLEALYREYKDRGLVILGFPCNQFLNQEPGDESEIKSTCLLNYGVTFPMFSKIEVNGEKTHPLFQFLKKRLGGFLTRSIKWNFTKFLIDREGRPVKRFMPLTAPSSLRSEIEKLL